MLAYHAVDLVKIDHRDGATKAAKMVRQCKRDRTISRTYYPGQHYK